jgi:hypothetical protein
LSGVKRARTVKISEPAATAGGAGHAQVNSAAQHRPAMLRDLRTPDSATCLRLLRSAHALR